jgi:cytochrome oxidase Cu insertion factor (SCO1/SenC/PrrC family)
MSAMPDDAPDGGAHFDEEERRAQFTKGPPKLPRKVIWIAIGIVAVLGIGGAYADQSFNVPPTSSPKQKVHHAKTVQRTLATFVSLRTLSGRPAPPIDLVDQAGLPFSLRSVSGRAVVLGFLDPRCRDICPVESAEVRDAEHDLGSRLASVAFVIVDANPHDLGAAAAKQGYLKSGLSSFPDVYFLSGSLVALDRIWKAYGVTVFFDPATGALAHTNVIDIINASGRLVYSLEPFGNELESGAYVLSTNEVQRFASGIARYAERAS